MQDNTKVVLSTFGAYAKAFETLVPDLVAPYFSPNSTLMTTDKIAFMSDANAVKAVFQELFDDLRTKNFDHSELHSPQVKQLSHNQAIVSGSATRYSKENKVIQSFGLTYTLRKEGNSWKIIFGILHDVV